MQVYQNLLEEVSAAFPSRAMVAVSNFADSFRLHLSEAFSARGSISVEMYKEVMGFYKCASWNVLSEQGLTPDEVFIGASAFIRFYPASGTGGEIFLLRSHPSNGPVEEKRKNSLWCVVALASNATGPSGECCKLVLRPCEEIPLQFDGYHPLAMRVNFEDAVQSEVIPLVPSDIRSIEHVAVIPDCSSRE